MLPTTTLTYLPWVKTLARDRADHEQARRGPSATWDAGDLAQEGFFGLRHAVKRYELKHRVRWKTYAHACITGKIGDYVRKEARARHVQRGYTTVCRRRTQVARWRARHDPDESSGVLWKMVKARDEDDPPPPDPALQVLPMLLERLQPREAQILRWLYGIGGERITDLEAARRLGISHSRVSQLRSHALAELRYFLGA